MVVTDPAQIYGLASPLFVLLFFTSPFVMHEDLFYQYPATVTAAMNNTLCVAPNLQEIWDAVNNLSADSAPGVDCFTGYFFRGCWQIIQGDMVDMVKGFFLGDYLLYLL